MRLSLLGVLLCRWFFEYLFERCDPFLRVKVDVLDVEIEACDFQDLSY